MEGNPQLFLYTERVPTQMGCYNRILSFLWNFRMSQINKIYFKQDQVDLQRNFSRCCIFISQQTVVLHVLQEFSVRTTPQGSFIIYIYNRQLYHMEGLCRPHVMALQASCSVDLGLKLGII